jgi:hypothetical protein
VCFGSSFSVRRVAAARFARDSRGNHPGSVSVPLCPNLFLFASDIEFGVRFRQFAALPLAANATQFKVGIELGPTAFIVAEVGHVNELCRLAPLKLPNTSEARWSETRRFF